VCAPDTSRDNERSVKCSLLVPEKIFFLHPGGEDSTLTGTSWLTASFAVSPQFSPEEIWRVITYRGVEVQG
jgi:hypothetical protein